MPHPLRWGATRTARLSFPPPPAAPIAQEHTSCPAHPCRFALRVTLGGPVRTADRFLQTPCNSAPPSSPGSPVAADAQYPTLGFPKHPSSTAPLASGPFARLVHSHCRFRSRPRVLHCDFPARTV